MSMIYKLVKQGFFDKTGLQEIKFEPIDLDFIDTGIRRIEEEHLHRKLTEVEKEIWISAFCSALTVAGEVLKPTPEEAVKALGIFINSMKKHMRRN